MSKFFDSDQVQTDLHNIFQTYQAIANKTSQLPMMSKEDKLKHIEDCKGLITKQKTFYTRLTLAANEDEQALEMKDRINSLSNAFGYQNLTECMEAMVRTLEQAAQQEIDRT